MKKIFYFTIAAFLLISSATCLIETSSVDAHPGNHHNPSHTEKSSHHHRSSSSSTPNHDLESCCQSLQTILVKSHYVTLLKTELKLKIQPPLFYANLDATIPVVRPWSDQVQRPPGAFVQTRTHLLTDPINAPPAA